MKIGDSVFIYLETKPHEDKWNNYFMDVAIRTSEMSKGKRLKVGAVAVKDKRIVCTGYNGTVSKYGDESLEDENGNTAVIAIDKSKAIDENYDPYYYWHPKDWQVRLDFINEKLKQYEN